MDALKSKGQMLDQINLENIPRSGFDLSYNNKGTGKLGRIIPVRCMETLPGDSIKGSTQVAMQFEPLAVPILSNMLLKHETWYVPNNIIWNGWDKFITKGQDLSDISKVPSFSLEKVFTIFKDLLVSANPTPSTARLRYVLGTMTASSSGAEDVKHRNFFLSFASVVAFVKYLRDVEVSEFLELQIDDLLDYRKDVCDQFLAYLSNADVLHITGTTGDGSAITEDVLPLYQSALWSSGTSVVSDVYVPITYTKYYNNSGSLSIGYYSPSMNDEKLIDTFVLSEQNYSSTGVRAYLPSDFFNAFINFISDYFSPLIGLGSNLDYLGYRFLRPLDFSYLLQLHFAKLAKDINNLYDLSVPTQTDSDAGFYLYDDILSFGVPIANGVMSVLPLRALYVIWWNNYRDQLLETAAPEPKDVTTISDTELLCLVVPRQRCWSKDAFTTALANTGTGNMVVPISQNVLAVNSVKRVGPLSGSLDNGVINDLDLGMMEYTLASGAKVQLPTRFLQGTGTGFTDTKGSTYGFSLDTLRRAGRTEKWIQKALIYGNRIQDALFTHWGVKIKNERLQLPEFVSSSSQLVKIDTILNNTTTAESVAGDKAGFASAYDSGNGFEYYSPENGFLLTLMTVRPEQSYPVGMPRYLGKLSIFDYAFPEFAQIGMDAVYLSEMNKRSTEVYFSSADSDASVFGYQGRYYDYKSKHDEEHGELLSTQDMYTFGRDFNFYSDKSVPKLNYRFVHCWPVLDMFVMDDPTADQFRYDVHHSVAASRALPVCGLSV